ncbi:restriction endonuclease subunit S [Campylobacter lari]|uniref:restriction endonuclease subunit S n=1 Tax=Campylobacter lari TaxID=201 RepID=UPI00057C81D1|nr:type I restriction/modification system, S subunit [Campylobacter lari]MCV3426377.1 type I restriction/modification system, S subunit [Campylobacter lari]MCV3458638.1 type I restriction/modification system, S subunit [Campylobacter lari]
MTNLPQSWEVKKLGEIFNIERGGSPRPIKEFLTDKEDGINWIKIGDIKNQKYLYATEEKIIQEGLKKSKLVIEGDLLISNSMSFGKPVIVKLQKGAIHDGWLLLKEKINLNKEYFYYLFSSNFMYDFLSYQASGSTVKNLNIDKLKQIEIPLPPLQEQERIVGILDESFAKIDESIKILEQDLLNLDELMQSALQKAFNPLKDNTKENYKLPQGWEKFNFDNIFYSPSSKNYQLNTKDYLEKGCIPIIDQSKKFIIGYSNNYEKVFKINNCNNSCIIFGDHTRVLKFIDFDFIVGADGVKILLNKDIERFNTKFLFFQLLYKDIPLLGYRRHFSVLKQNTFSIPPLKEQEQIASHLDELSSHVKNLKQNYQMQIKNLQELKKSLLDKAFQGRL